MLGASGLLCGVCWYVSSPGHRAAGLGTWRDLDCGWGGDVLFLFWVEVIEGHREVGVSVG